MIFEDYTSNGRKLVLTLITLGLLLVNIIVLRRDVTEGDLSIINTDNKIVVQNQHNSPFILWTIRNTSEVSKSFTIKIGTWKTAVVNLEPDDSIEFYTKETDSLDANNAFILEEVTVDTDITKDDLLGTVEKIGNANSAIMKIQNNAGEASPVAYQIVSYKDNRVFSIYDGSFDSIERFSERKGEFTYFGDDRELKVFCWPTRFFKE